MRALAAMLLGVSFALLTTGAVHAEAARDGGIGVTSLSLPVAGTMSLTEAASVLVLQEPARGAGRNDGFISFDTVIIGCTAGAAAGALAIALPVLTVASSGIGLPASASAIISTAGIGCAVGVVSGLAAIGTAWGLNVMNSFGDSGGN
ncbi:MAG: hypothetical protein WCO00_07035 [Rhodospirillaceae bacterium]